jgi:hypothetical protein
MRKDKLPPTFWPRAGENQPFYHRHFMVSENVLQQILDALKRIEATNSRPQAPDTSTGDFVQARDAARQLRCTTEWLSKRANAGKLTKYKEGRKVFYSRSEVIKLIGQGGTKGPPR